MVIKNQEVILRIGIEISLNHQYFGTNGLIFSMPIVSRQNPNKKRQENRKQKRPPGLY
jgi:hypothetical protein